MRKLVFLALAACASLALAQGPPPGGPGGGGPGGGGGRGMPAPTNLKVLTPENYIGVMFAMPAALGVKCDFCHNMQDRASDEKPTKVTARKMMQMVKDINANTFNGEQKVACWTCHRGEQKPASPPPPPARGGPGGPGGPPPGAAPAGGAPPAGPGR